MRTILFLLRKEFLQVFRDRSMLPIIFIMPLVQLFVLAYAANFELRNIKVHIIDLDQTSTSRLLISKFSASRFFRITGYSFSGKQATDDLLSDQARLVINIPPNFEKDLVAAKEARIQLVINAIDGSAAAIANGYANAIIRDFNSQIISEWMNHVSLKPLQTIQSTVSYWYNPEMDYKTFMVPGILVMLVTLIGAFLSGMNIVKEKEFGTLEQINVTPIQKYQFIIGKLLPFWIIALFELAFGLIFAKLMFNIPMAGSIFLVFLFASVYLLVVLGMGLMVSTISETQQQAMFLSWFFMVIFVLMSGLFTPIESMPGWAQVLTKINPIAYFVEVMRMVLLKGAGFADIKNHFLMLSVYAFIMLSLATWRYRKVSA